MHTRRTRKGVRAGQQSSIPIDQSHYLLLHHILFTKVMCWKSEVGILRCLTGGLNNNYHFIYLHSLPMLAECYFSPEPAL